MTFGPYDMLMDFALMSVLLFVAQFMRAKIKLIQNLYLPSSLVAGFMGLLLGHQFLNVMPFSGNIASYAYLLVVVLFASLFIGKSEKKSFKKVINKVGDTFTLNMAAELGQFGFSILAGTLILTAFFPDVFHAFSILLPAGFVGGHGYAAAIGGALQDLAGWEDALTIGQTFATIGLLLGIFGGLIQINIATRNKSTRFIKTMGELPKSMQTGLIPEAERVSMGQETISPMAMDPFSWHIAIVLIATAGGYYLTNFLNNLFGISVPMMSVAMLVGVAVQFMITKLNLSGYVDKRVVTRIGSSVTDYLVAFGVASINIAVVMEYAAPIIIMVLLGLSFTLFNVYYIGRKLFRTFWFERSIFMFGWTTGVVAMGVTLLRIVDPEYKSGTLEDYGMAYVFIAVIEVALVTLAPIYVALGRTSALITGLVLMVLTVALWGFTAKKYGVYKGGVADFRSGEKELIEEFMQERGKKEVLKDVLLEES